MFFSLLHGWSPIKVYIREAMHELKCSNFRWSVSLWMQETFGPAGLIGKGVWYCVALSFLWSCFWSVWVGGWETESKPLLGCVCVCCCFFYSLLMFIVTQNTVKIKIRNGGIGENVSGGSGEKREIAVNEWLDLLISAHFVTALISWALLPCVPSIPVVSSFPRGVTFRWPFSL